MSKEKILILIAHPDDEALYFSQGIFNLKWKYDVDVACATYSKNSIRGNEFASSCQELGVNPIYLDCFDLGFYSLIPDLSQRIFELLKSNKYRIIITHAPDGGEKPHPHHIQLHIVCRYISKKLKIDFKFFSEKKNIPVMKKVNSSLYRVCYLKVLMQLYVISSFNKMLFIDITLKAIYLIIKDQNKIILEDTFLVDEELRLKCLMAHKSQNEVINQYSVRNYKREYLWY